MINPKTWQVIYRGPVDDRMDYGVQKAAAHNFADDALGAMLAGKPIQQASVQSKGCLIDFPERAKRAEHAKISYAKDVAPILEAKCVACHQEGGIGPFAMTNYADGQGLLPDDPRGASAPTGCRPITPTRTSASSRTRRT